MRSASPNAEFLLNPGCQSVHTNCQARESHPGSPLEQYAHEDMHEVSIMAEAVRMAVESAQAAGATRITGLRLRVGRLSGAVPEALRFAWDVVRRDTLAAGAGLEIESVPAASWCATCQVEFECADFMAECPRCRRPARELRRGRELEIVSVETLRDHTPLLEEQML
jgi:hydrogenase nickel incorporation protein HypA/HybF